MSSTTDPAPLLNSNALVCKMETWPLIQKILRLWEELHKSVRRKLVVKYSVQKTS